VIYSQIIEFDAMVQTLDRTCKTTNLLTTFGKIKVVHNRPIVYPMASKSAEVSIRLAVNVYRTCAVVSKTV